MNDEHPNFQLDELALGAFGAVQCPKCGLLWTNSFVPEFCPECGTRVADKAGEGIEPLLALTKLAGRPFATITCSHCGLRIPAEWEFPECQRCKRLLKLTPMRKTPMLARIRNWFNRFQNP